MQKSLDIPLDYVEKVWHTMGVLMLFASLKPCAVSDGIVV